MRTAVFASGGGSNFQAIVDAGKNGIINSEVVLCISDRDEAGVLVRARDEKIESIVIRSDQFETRGEFSETLLAHLSDRKIDLITLAGYMKKIPLRLIQKYPNRILNIHPAILPDFGGKGMFGMHVHRAVIESGTRFSGATVHYVDEGYDTGPTLLQRRIPVLETDTPESLAARVLEVEHELYPAAIQLLEKHAAGS